MGKNLNLYFATQSQPDAVLAEVCKRFPPERTSPFRHREGRTLTDYLYEDFSVSADLSPQFISDYIYSHFGFTPNHEIYFMHSWGLFASKSSMRLLVNMISLLLAEIPGDAVLIWEGMYAWLLRKEDKLCIDLNRSSIWNENTLSVFDLDCDVCDLSFYY